MAKWMLLRGLIRGNGHWGDFPKILAASGVEVELMEIPGNGTQNHKATPSNAIAVIEDIKSRSIFYKSREPFHICGISLGGMIALKWAEQFPKDLKSIAVVNTSLKQNSSIRERLLPKNYFKIAASLFNPSILALEKLVLELTSNNPDALKNLDSFVSFSKEHPVSRKNFFKQLMLANSVAINLPITIPTQIIASKNDHLVSSICSERLAEELNIKPIFHPTAGHDLPLDDPEWLSSTLLNA